MKHQLCEVCGEKPYEHIHHIDENHKNNKPKNLQKVCTLCHSEIHGIEPKYSEIRKLVTLYLRTQKARCAIANQIRGFAGIELRLPKFFEKLLKQLEDQEKLYSKQIKSLLENKHSKIETQTISVKSNKTSKRGSHSNDDNHFNIASPYPIYPWLKEIKGISHLLAAKLIALIDIKNTPMVSSLWAYAGQTPDSKRTKGKKCNWNHELKMVCYQISDSFVKHRTPKYREIYNKEKEHQLQLLGNARSAMKPRRALHSNNNEESHRKRVKPLKICSPPKSKLHVERRARRKAVKAFLKDLWIEWKRVEN